MMMKMVSVSFRSSILFYEIPEITNAKKIKMFPSPFGVLFFFIKLYYLYYILKIHCFRLLSEFYSFLY